MKQRVAFGIVRLKRESEDNEESLTEYNVFQDHKADKVRKHQLDSYQPLDHTNELQ